MWRKRRGGADSFYGTREPWKYCAVSCDSINYKRQLKIGEDAFFIRPKIDPCPNVVAFTKSTSAMAATVYVTKSHFAVVYIHLLQRLTFATESSSCPVAVSVIHKHLLAPWERR